MIELIIGGLLIAASGGLLHDVPFNRFILSLILYTIGSSVFDSGMKVVLG